MARASLPISCSSRVVQELQGAEAPASQKVLLVDGGLDWCVQARQWKWRAARFLSPLPERELSRSCDRRFRRVYRGISSKHGLRGLWTPGLQD